MCKPSVRCIRSSIKIIKTNTLHHQLLREHCGRRSTHAKGRWGHTCDTLTTINTFDDWTEYLSSTSTSHSRCVRATMCIYGYYVVVLLALSTLYPLRPPALRIDGYRRKCVTPKKSMFRWRYGDQAAICIRDTKRTCVVRRRPIRIVTQPLLHICSTRSSFLSTRRTLTYAELMTQPTH